MKISDKHIAEFAEIKDLIRAVKQKTHASVNTTLIDLYWNVGAYVHDKIQSSEWGESVVKELAVFIQKNEPEHGKGFSAQNIWRIKQFYATYSSNKKLSALTRELSWTNNMLILSKSNIRL